MSLDSFVATIIEKTFFNFIYGSDTDVQGEGYQHWVYEHLDPDTKSIVKQLYFCKENNIDKKAELFSELEGCLRNDVLRVCYSNGSEKNPKSIIRQNPAYMSKGGFNNLMKLVDEVKSAKYDNPEQK